MRRHMGLRKVRHFCITTTSQIIGAAAAAPAAPLSTPLSIYIKSVLILKKKKYYASPYIVFLYLIMFRVLFGFILCYYYKTPTSPAIICTNYGPGKWHQFLQGSPTNALGPKPKAPGSILIHWWTCLAGQYNAIGTLVRLTIS